MTKAELVFGPGVPKMRERQFVSLIAPSREGGAVTRPIRRHLVEWARESGFWDNLASRQQQVLDMRYGNTPMTGPAIGEQLGIPGPDVSIIERWAIKKIILAKVGGPQELLKQSRLDGRWDYLDPTERTVLKKLHALIEGPRGIKKEDLATRLGISGEDQVAVIEAQAIEKLYTLSYQQSTLAEEEKIPA